MHSIPRRPQPVYAHYLLGWAGLRLASKDDGASSAMSMRCVVVKVVVRCVEAIQARQRERGSPPGRLLAGIPTITLLRYASQQANSCYASQWAGCIRK